MHMNHKFKCNLNFVGSERNNMIEIYVIEKYDTFSESSNVYCAYEDEDDANTEAERLNEEEKVKEKIYDKWLLNGDDDSFPPESGENVFTVTKTTLHKI